MNQQDSDSSHSGEDADLSPAGSPPPFEDEEMRDFQTVFSYMIDRTCSDDGTENGNIFQDNFNPEDGCKSFFRSMVPGVDLIQQEFSSASAHQLFQYNDNDGMKYSFKVLDRRNNVLSYEKMPSYHRYAMRLLFRGAIQRELLHTRAIRKFFKKETLRLGRAFNEPKSHKHIASFVKMYQINLNELLYPDVSDYRTFNEFFYRRLKKDARPIANPNDPGTIVSAADCRLVVFDNVDEATRIWIKGRHFSLRHLFHDGGMAKEFYGGSIAVFRLAPVDYHRFHSPIDGTIGPNITEILGTYYTVNPIAIKGKLDVLTKNQRTMITIENNLFERIAFVAIGALLVGSVNFTVQTNQTIKKGDELGYFAYGGSTIVVVFKAGMVKWDDDLLHNSNNSMETLVRVGEKIGVRTSDDECQKYLRNLKPNLEKNSTITKLFDHFPMSKLSH